MDLILLALLFNGVTSALIYYYFCRLCNTPCRWYFNIAYAALSCGLAFFRFIISVGDFLYVLPSILLLTVCGTLFQKCRFMEAFALSSLSISVCNAMAGVIQSLAFWIVSVTTSEIIFQGAGIVEPMATIGLIAFTFHMITTVFPGNMRTTRQPFLLLLLMPFLFITFVGAFLSDTVYGYITEWDTVKGLIFPNVNNLELLALRLLACGGLGSTLFAYKRLVQSIEREQAIQLLERQTQNQETYVKEAKERYEQTRSFRHDVKNHLLVLHRLLADKKPDAAQEYLEKLKEISDTLSFPVHTGNSAADALLGSKLALAAGKGIYVDCTVHIPQHSGVNDMDWCIVLSNALDNAINASEELHGQDKMIRVFGSQQGNIYLLNIENRCRPCTEPLKAGIGLSNIEAVLNKYNGKMEVEITDNIFKLSALFVIPQQSGRISQQSY